MNSSVGCNSLFLTIQQVVCNSVGPRLTTNRSNRFGRRSSVAWSRSKDVLQICINKVAGIGIFLSCGNLESGILVLLRRVEELYAGFVACLPLIPASWILDDETIMCACCVAPGEIRIRCGRGGRRWSRMGCSSCGWTR